MAASDQNSKMFKPCETQQFLLSNLIGDKLGFRFFIRHLNYLDRQLIVEQGGIGWYWYLGIHLPADNEFFPANAGELFHYFHEVAPTMLSSFQNHRRCRE